MQYKQIFKKEDGRPILIKSTYDKKQKKDVFKFDDSKYIDDMPPSKLYEPIHYDEENKEWVGTDYEIYKENLDKEYEEELKKEGLI